MKKLLKRLKIGQNIISLVKRGNLSIFISDSLIKNGCITTPKKTNEPGRPQKYSNELIEFMLTIRELFHLPLRQTAGFVSFLFSSMGIISGILDYTTISKECPILKSVIMEKFIVIIMKVSLC